MDEYQRYIEELARLYDGIRMHYARLNTKAVYKEGLCFTMHDLAVMEEFVKEGITIHQKYQKIFHDEEMKNKKQPVFRLIQEKEQMKCSICRHVTMMSMLDVAKSKKIPVCKLHFQQAIQNLIDNKI